ncbi:hypothetical protein ACF0H5_012725 [Mactra antiquata]
MGLYSECIELFLCFTIFLPSGYSLDSDGQTPHFDVTDWNVTAVSGTIAVLPCTVTGISDENYKVAWTDSRKKLLTVAEKRIITDTRMSVERPITKSWNLHIRNVRLNDSGTYHCQLNTKEPKHMKVILTVHDPPYIKDHAGDQYVEEGSTVTLWCNANGTPPPSITWYRHYIYDNTAGIEVIGEQGETLMIHNISRHCEDIYECVASNNVQPNARQKMNVTVQFKPEVVLYSKSMSQKQGKETIIACEITANPFGFVVWQRKGREITNSHKYGISVFTDKRHTKTLNLRIGNINEKDYGKYRCYAQNNHGEDFEEMTLYELKERKPSTRPTADPFLIDTKTLRHPHRGGGYNNRGHWNDYPTPPRDTAGSMSGKTWASSGGSGQTYKVNMVIRIVSGCLFIQNILRVFHS